MFIINSYHAKKQTPVVLRLLVKRCSNILLCYLTIQNLLWADLQTLYNLDWSMKLCNGNNWTNTLTFIYIENVIRLVFIETLFYCDHQKLNLTGGFFIFLFMVTGREIIFIWSAEHVRKSPVICTTQLAGGLLLKKQKIFEVMLNIFGFSHVRENV